MAGFREVLEEVVDELEVQRKVGKHNVPGVMGPPGIGKSELAAEAAQRMGVRFYPTNVGDNGDPTDVTGTPVPLGVVENRTLIIPESAQIEAVEDYVRTQLLKRDEAEEKVERIVWALNKGSYTACTEPTLLLWDDFDKASDVIMKSLIGLFGTRSFRDYRLHPDSILMCAGNRVGDDILAGEISASILGRVSIIEMDAKLADFEAYAEKSGEIDSDILGFLRSDPDMLWQPPKEGAYAAPSPRSWWMVSKHFEHLGEDNGTAAWKHKRLRIIERKCGVGIANTWTAWWNILSKVDVVSILNSGPTPPPADENPRTYRYACVFAVSKYIRNNKPTAKWAGFRAFLDSLEDEFRLAFLTQVTGKRRTELVNCFPGIGNQLLGSLLKDEDE